MNHAAIVTVEQRIDDAGIILIAPGQVNLVCDVGIEDWHTKDRREFVRVRRRIDNIICPQREIGVGEISPNVDIQAKGKAVDDRRCRIVRRAVDHGRRGIISTAPAATATPSTATMVAATAMPAAAPVISGDGGIRNRHHGAGRGENNPNRQSR
jgi:hypothetical protein